MAPCGLLAILAGALLFLLPPHSAILTIVLGVGGVVAFALGMVRFAGGPWWALIVSVISGVLLFAALNVAGRGLVLHTFGRSEICLIAKRQEVDTSARYRHYGFVHTVDCPDAGTLTIRTDSTDRQTPGARVRVLDDPGGLFEPDFADRQNLPVDIIAILGALGLIGASFAVIRARSTRAASGE